MVYVSRQGNRSRICGVRKMHLQHESEHNGGKERVKQFVIKSGHDAAVADYQKLIENVKKGKHEY